MLDGGGTSFDEGAACASAYGTTYPALVERATLRAGEVLLVLGATGGVGLAAVELGKRMGAIVIAAGGSDDKLAVARDYGADHLLNYRRERIRDRVKALTAGEGADVVYDPVGGELADQALTSIAWGARYLVVGFAAGTIPSIPANRCLIKRMGHKPPSQKRAGQPGLTGCRCAFQGGGTGVITDLV